MENIIDFIAYMLSYLYPDKCIRGIRHFKSLIISQKYKRKFKSAGKGLYIKRINMILGAECITIGYGFKARENLRLEAIKSFRGSQYKPQISIGNNVNMGMDCHVGAINRVIIGNNVLIGNRVLITDHNHGNNSIEEINKLAVDRKLFSKDKVEIGENVWIGDGVAILPGVRIGDNAVIGVNSVITRDIPSNTIAAGVPAKVIRVIKEDKPSAKV